MARTRTSTRPRKSGARGRETRPLRARTGAALRRLLIFSRPRSASELLALLFVCLALLYTALVGLEQLLNRRTARQELLWGVVLLLAGAGARLSPWLRTRTISLSGERLRGYAGSLLLAMVALCISARLLGPGLGLGQTYLLPGPLSGELAAPVALAALFLLSIVLLFNLPAHRWLRSLARLAAESAARARRSEVLQTTDVHYAADVEAQDEIAAAIPAAAVEESPEQRAASATTARSDSREPQGELSPPVEIFVPTPRGPATPVDLELKERRIQETLASFNVAARVVGHHHGPVVTQFDIQPERGVKVRRITELEKDLALALAAPTIRIQAPVPGKSVVGIEIPNASASVVALRELLESDAYRSMTSPLRVVLGKDVAGNPAVIDLARMPHLLIAGATGSGKSVCVNALISCLLYQNRPEQVRLMMIDPKMVELTVYNGVPHLLSPVVTQMDRVVGVLQWTLREMERRYQIFADAGVRNIQRYNERNEGGRLPYIVLVIDELADLMMVAPEDVESAICRLAQLARAAGIHVVIATQRPSVDVITGLIKANFPARIAFMMTSQVDSRTILDAAGAEKLLGRGDMLYLPPDASKPVRLQGAHVSDGEIERLVEFWRRSPLRAAVQQVREEEFASAEREAGQTTDDLLSEAARTVRDYQHASVSLLQRRLKVGYARAARLMDQLEAQGVVGPADGSKQRPVLPADHDFEA